MKAQETDSIRSSLVQIMQDEREIIRYALDNLNQGDLTDSEIGIIRDLKARL